MDMQLAYHPFNGLGDKLLDVIGMCVLCELRSMEPVVEWYDDGQRYVWGGTWYDDRLFDFPFHVATIAASPDVRRLIVPNRCVSVSPPMIHAAEEGRVSMERICQLFKAHAAAIVRPSPSRIAFPDDMASVKGIHLRRSDKIVARDNTHETSVEHYDRIMRRLCAHLTDTMRDGDRYYVCSEEREFREQFAASLLAVAAERGVRDVSIVEPVCPADAAALPTTPDDACSYESVRDMFYLSRCAEIYQGTKFSTFSVLAAIVGQVPLYNFADHDACSLLHIYKPCLAKLVCDTIDPDVALAAHAASPWPRFSIE